MLTAIACLLALLLDRLLGEPRHGHPLVAFGRLAAATESRLNGPDRHRRLRGGLGVAALVLPWFLFAVWIETAFQGWLLLGAQVVGLYLCIGLCSLDRHARAVAEPLAAGDLPAARAAVAMLVSRDSDALDAEGVAVAATESVLENGSDAVFASLFWFAVAGLPGVIVHRLVNTLDAMWGYRTARFACFGLAAARLDDLLNWIPARLTALGYALAGRAGPALRCWRRQAAAWDSPNAGPVMAAGAGALGVRLGGPAPYHGSLRNRPPLGDGMVPDAGSIGAALGLVYRALVIWLLVLAGAGLLRGVIGHG